MVTGESPGEGEESSPADEVSLQKALTKEAFFVNFLRTDEYDEDGVRTIYSQHPYTKNSLKLMSPKIGRISCVHCIWFVVIHAEVLVPLLSEQHHQMEARVSVLGIRGIGKKVSVGR